MKALMSDHICKLIRSQMEKRIAILQIFNKKSRLSFHFRKGQVRRDLIVRTKKEAIFIISTSAQALTHLTALSNRVNPTEEQELKDFKNQIRKVVLILEVLPVRKEQQTLSLLVLLK